MRDWLRQSLLNSFSLYLVAAVYPGLIIPKTLWQLLWVGVTFTLLNYLAKPLIKLILLPLNLLTLGLLSWLSGVLVLVIAVRLATIGLFRSRLEPQPMVEFYLDQSQS